MSVFCAFRRTGRHYDGQERHAQEVDFFHIENDQHARQRQGRKSDSRRYLANTPAGAHS